MSQLETNEGVNDNEDNKMIKWLTENRLLKIKEKFINNDISLDDLKALDLKIDLKLINIPFILSLISVQHNT